MCTKYPCWAYPLLCHFLNYLHKKVRLDAHNLQEPRLLQDDACLLATFTFREHLSKNSLRTKGIPRGPVRRQIPAAYLFPLICYLLYLDSLLGSLSGAPLAWVGFRTMRPAASVPEETAPRDLQRLLGGCVAPLISRHETRGRPLLQWKHG